MHQKWRVATHGMSALTLLALAGCTSVGPRDAQAHEPTHSDAVPGVYGSPADPSRVEPTEVATDAPVTVSPGRTASIFITQHGWNSSSGQVEISGYLAGLYETEGTCTVTLTAGSRSVSASTPATPDATSTSCGGLAVPGSKLSSGTWSAVVTYESATSRGTSEPVQVDVP
jgi:hypothetical protein